MSTNSTISILRQDGSIDSIYCHWSGNSEHVGKKLQAYYNSEDIVNELIELGSLSSLRERIKPNENETHSFEKPLCDVTVAYHRDRGEELVVNKLNGINELNKLKNRLEWNYLFIDGIWYVAKEKTKDFLPLKDYLK